MIKVLKLNAAQKARVMEILDNGGTEEELNEYLTALIEPLTTQASPSSSRPAVTNRTSRSREIQESQLLAAASLTTLH